MKDFERVINLQSKCKNGEKFEYELFWKGPFSQWDKHGFTIDGVFYKTAEYWMMAEKARLFNDEETLQKIIAAKSPREAKDLGRKIKGFNEEIWAEHRYDIVRIGNIYKFSQNEDLKQILLNTGNKILIEASPVDSIWGIGLAEKDPRAKDPTQWLGLNLLGFALTDVRDALQHG